MKNNIKHTLLLAVFLLLSAAYPVYASDLFSVLPWNGYTGAVSLTFDDGDPIHLDLAIPEMQKRGLKGTFFLIAGNTSRQEEWKKAARDGMEIGNHSMNHRRAAELSADDEITEVDSAGEILKELSGQPVITFAYPFVEITDGLKARIEKNCIAARGGYGQYNYNSESQPDWLNISGRTTMTDYDIEKYKSWIDQAMYSGAWTVFMIHAVEGSDWYQPVPKKTFLGILDYLKENEKDLWIAPFGEVAAYWKAQKILENAKVIKVNNNYYLKWSKSKIFPCGVIVKVKVYGDKFIISQDGSELKQISPGVYPVMFDSGNLEFRRLKMLKKTGRVIEPESLVLNGKI